jgi:hypothetical protein
MAAYVKLTNFASKDGLLSGNPLKVVTGAELDDEFNALALSSQQNYDSLDEAVEAAFIKWTYNSSTTMADPGAGIVRFNNATPASVTAIAIDDLNVDGVDVSAYVVSWDDSTGSTNKGTLTFRQGNTFAIFSVTGLTDNSGWTQLAVTYVTGSGSFTSGTNCYVSFYKTGEASADVSTVAGISADVTTVAGISANVTTVAGISGNVTTVAGIASDVSAVAAQFIGWNFSTTTSMADPGSGIMRFNNATIASVTAIAFDDNNSAAADVSAYVLTWDDATSTNKGTITVRQGTANYAIFSVTGLTDNVGWTEVAVTHVASSGSFSNATLTFVDFDRTGDAGTGDMTGPASSVDSELALFSGTDGKTIKRATTTGVLKATSGVLAEASAGTDYVAPGTATTFTATQTFKGTTDTVYTITDGAAFEINPANGNIQVVTLGANRTPAATNFVAGQSVLLGIDDGSTYTITWTTVSPTWVKVGGTASAPTLATSGYTWLLLWKAGSTIYGCEVGKP